MAFAQSGADSPGLEYPRLERPVHLNIPRDLWHLSQYWETGLVKLRIGPEGDVKDWIPINLPHYRLVRALDRAFQQASFTPPMENGEPITVDLPATIPLHEATMYGVISETIAEHVESQITRINPKVNQLVVSPPGELDRPLELVSRGRSYGVLDENGEPVGGTVVVEFYIDTQGRPRMIRPEAEADPVLADAAVRTVANFQFAPPRRNAQPTVVRARMPIVLD